MVVYVIGKDFAIKNTAATDNTKYRIIDDRVITSAFSSCELTIEYTGKAAELCDVGDYLYIPSRGVYDGFFQIISTDIDYVAKTARISAESNLLYWYSQRGTGGVFGRISEVGKTISWYLEEFTAAPFPYKIKSNEIPAVGRTGDTSATTAKECLEKVAALFNAEILLSYELEGETVTPYIEIKQATSGTDTGEILTVGREITNFSKSESCADVATSVYIRGGIKASKRYDNVSAMTDDEELEINTVVIAANTPYCNRQLTVALTQAAMVDPLKIYKYSNNYYKGNPTGQNQETVRGWETQEGFAVNLENSTIGQEDYVDTPLPAYDDGDYFVQGGRLVSRSMWARYAADGLGVTQAGFGAEIALNPSDLETVEQSDILAQGIALLDEHKGTTVSYECDCTKRVKFNGFYTLAIPEESIYISARCLEIEESETAGTYRPVFGEYLIKTNAFEVMARNAKGGF